MLPGKTYRPEDFVRIVLKRIWLLVVPVAAAAAGAGIYADGLPDLYRSESTIMIVPPRVPNSIVVDIMPTRIDERLPAIRNQILSRTRLEAVILDLNLYPELRATWLMEQVVDEMRRNVTVLPAQGNAFIVRFVGRDPVTVMRVAERLGQSFINEGLRFRETLTQGTTSFLQAQLDEARARLQAHEQKVAAYRRQFAGELPEQQGSNLSAAQNLQAQGQALLQNISQNQERRLMIERQIAELENQIVDPVADVPPAGGGTTVQQLAAARATLAQLELRWTAQHPEVILGRQLVADLEAKAEAEALQTPLSANAGPATSPAEAARQRRLGDLRSELDLLAKEIDRQLTDERQARQAAQLYQQRAEAGPTRQTEMYELMRDYNQYQSTYAGLLAKNEAVALSADLEASQVGEQFTLLDPARIPQVPFSPDRTRIGQMGLLGGLAFGVAIIALLEYRDRSLKTEDDVKAVVALPVLAVVPLMQSAGERRRAIQFRVLRTAVLGSFIVLCLAIYVRVFVW